jgi:nicotinamidase-related amidase
MSNLSHSALLVMDYQEGIVSRFGGAGLTDNARAAIDAARAAGMKIIYVVVKFRVGYPEISPNNMSFSRIKDGGFNFDETSPATAIHGSVTPEPGDIVVVKRRVGAFSGSDLDIVLRAQGIKSLVLAGISTSGVVLSTLRVAADMDYQITVLSDACADTDEEVHRVLMEKVFPRQAQVETVDAWRQGLGSAEVA